MFSSRVLPPLVLAVAVLAGSTLVVPRAVAQAKENPIVAQVKAAVKDPAQPFTLIVRLNVKEKKRGRSSFQFLGGGSGVGEAFLGRPGGLNRGHCESGTLLV